MYLKQWLRSQLRRILNLLMKRLDQGQFHPKREAPKTNLFLPGKNQSRNLKPESIPGTESGIEYKIYIGCRAGS